MHEEQVRSCAWCGKPFKVRTHNQRFCPGSGNLHPCKTKWHNKDRLSKQRKPTMSNDAYQETVSRLEPEIAAIDAGYANTSIAISLRRIADALDWAKGLIEAKLAEEAAEDARQQG